MDQLKKSFVAMRRRLKLEKKYASHPMSLHATDKWRVPDLPIEIMTEILSRLPTKSVMKFRVVCKLWKSITTTSYFLEIHSKRGLLLRSPNILTFDACSNTITVIDSTSWEITLQIKSPATEYLRFEGSCNGILCMYNEMLASIELLNPTTCESITIRQPPVNGGTFKFHLGFDPSTKKFKVVCRHLYYPVNGGYIHTVGDSTWRLFEKIPDECRKEAVYSNGALHWLGTKDKRNFFYTLDLKDETMNSMDISNVIPSIYNARLGEFEGIIWMWQYYSYVKGNHTEGRINMFMMGSNHDKDPWILNHTIKGVPQATWSWHQWSLRLSPLIIMQNKKVVFCDWFKNWLTCYNIQNRRWWKGGYKVCYDLLKNSLYTGKSRRDWDRDPKIVPGNCIAFRENLMTPVYNVASKSPTSSY